jgi:cob(I)alamin adenosyltransferase
METSGVMKIYTKTGDQGETGLFDGTRVSKADARVEAYGAVDELNAWLGLVRSHVAGERADAMLLEIQRDLFAMGAMLAARTYRARVEARSAPTSPASSTGSASSLLGAIAAALHPCRRLRRPARCTLRTVCRRAGRRIVYQGSGRTTCPC